MDDFTLLFLATTDHYIVYAECRDGEAKPLEIKRPALMSFASNGNHFDKSSLSHIAGAEVAGQALFQTVFHHETQTVFFDARSRSSERGLVLRIVLKFPFCPELQSIPWELLHDGEQFLCLNNAPMTPIIRYTTGRVKPPEKPPEGKLRLLITTACPENMAPLEIKDEIAAIQSALEKHKDRVELEILENISIDKLRTHWENQVLKERACHIWHHCGHGDYRNTLEGHQFSLILDDEGEPEAACGSDLTKLISINPVLRAVLLNVCYSGESHGLARLLAEIHIPLIVGYCGLIEDWVCLKFSKSFYTAIHHAPVEVAIARTRMTLWAKDSSNEMAWSKPLVHCRFRAPALVDKYQPDPEPCEGTPSRQDQVEVQGVSSEHPGPGSIWTNPKRYRGPGGISFVRIDANKGVMGSKQDPFNITPSDEWPLTWVRLSKAMYMAETPLSIGELKRLFDGYQRQGHHLVDVLKKIYLQADSQLPVTGVSAIAAEEILKILNKLDPRLIFRLPSEAEWEIAARAGDASGDILEQVRQARLNHAWSKEQGKSLPREVTLGKKNRWGLYDMLGNVLEWCATPWAQYPGGEVKDWRPTHHSERAVLRGGSFAKPIDQCRYATRFTAPRDVGAPDAGLRLVCEPLTDAFHIAGAADKELT